MNYLQTLVKISKTGDYQKPPELCFDNLDLLHKIIVSPHATMALEIMQETGFFNDLIPEIKKSFNLKSDKHFKKIWPHTLVVVGQSPPNLSIRWAAFFHDLGKVETFSDDGKISFHNHEFLSARIFNRFAQNTKIFKPFLKKKIHSMVSNLGYVESYLPSWTDNAVKRFDKEVGNYLDDLFLLSKADITTANQEKRKRFIENTNTFYNRIVSLREEEKNRVVLPKGLGLIICEKLSIKPGPEINTVKNILIGKIKSGNLENNGTIEYYVAWIDENIELLSKVT
jgi:poly(A) polymerase